MIPRAFRGLYKSLMIYLEFKAVTYACSYRYRYAVRSCTVVTMLVTTIGIMGVMYDLLFIVYTSISQVR